MIVARLEAVNAAREASALPYVKKPSGIGKVPVNGPVEIREPGTQRDGLGSGLVGDVIGNHSVHGGTYQAVYAFARESLDTWTDLLGMRPPAGYFGENLTTCGIDVDGALLGERWRVGSDVLLQVTEPRIPCATFRGWVDQPGWLRRFTEAGRPGAYLRVIHGGRVRADDEIRVEHRPVHGISIAFAFRAMLLDRPALPELLRAGDDLTPGLRKKAAAQQSKDAPVGP